MKLMAGLLLALVLGGTALLSPGGGARASLQDDDYFGAPVPGCI